MEHKTLLSDVNDLYGGCQDFVGDVCQQGQGLLQAEPRIVYTGSSTGLPLHSMQPMDFSSGYHVNNSQQHAGDDRLSSFYDASHCGLHNGLHERELTYEPVMMLGEHLTSSTAAAQNRPSAMGHPHMTPVRRTPSDMLTPLHDTVLGHLARECEEFFTATDCQLEPAEDDSAAMCCTPYTALNAVDISPSAFTFPGSGTPLKA